MTYQKEVSRELQDRVNAKLLECQELILEKMGVAVSIPAVSYKLRGHVAGYMYHKGTMKINAQLLTDNATAMLEDTVPHEFAHWVITNIKPTGIKRRGVWSSHGAQWKKVMRLLGCSPDRCHTLKTTAARVVPKKFTYVCGCEDNTRKRKFTAIRHKRAQAHVPRSGRLEYYNCTRCKQPLVFCGG